MSSEGQIEAPREGDDAVKRSTPKTTNIEQMEAKLREDGIKYCIGAYVDIHGAPKGKVVPIDHFENFANGSERYTGYALDGLGQGPNDDEITSVPDLTSYIQLPWNKDVAWFCADNHFQGKPYDLSTRVVLQNVVEKAREMGFGLNLGIECELFVVKREEDGSLSIPNKKDKLTKSCYDVQSFMDRYKWLDKVATTINDLGWDLYSFDHEDANSQFEFDFKHTDALTMCDQFTFFRHMAKQYAEEEGLEAIYMPKPFADKTGSGAHFNMSLYDLETGENLFESAEDERGLSELGYQFTAGILKHGPALCATFAPTVNSYKRLVRRGLMSYYSWAPVFNSYGCNNRTNSVRIPNGGGRVESRNPDMACNPYLAAAMVFSAGLEGIREKLNPGPSQEDNLYGLSEAELAERGIKELPRTLMEAVECFKSDPFVEETLGAGLRQEFIDYKTEEWLQYHQRISQWEVDTYSSLY